jgi:hypothetical protein
MLQNGYNRAECCRKIMQPGKMISGGLVDLRKRHVVNHKRENKVNEGLLTMVSGSKPLWWLWHHIGQASNTIQAMVDGKKPRKADDFDGSRF